MCGIAERLFERLHNELQVEFSKRERGLVRTFSINTKNASEDLYSSILKIVEEVLSDVKNGEIQKMEICRGENIDSGVRQTEILRGVCYEIYCFDCFSMCYLRVLWERGLVYRREWISVDADEILKSPWFSEES